MILEKSYQKIKNIFLGVIENPQSSKILDIGCGLRGNFCALPKQSYLGIDQNKSIIKKISQRPDGEYHLMDARKMEFKKESFDYVISTSFFHHISDDELKNILSIIKHVLKKNGKIVIADGVYPESGFNLVGKLIRFLDRGRYVRSREDFQKIFAQDFYIEREYYFQDKIFAYSVLTMRNSEDKQEKTHV